MMKFILGFFIDKYRSFLQVNTIILVAHSCAEVSISLQYLQKHVGTKLIFIFACR